MAAIKFLNVVAKDGQTAAQRFAAMTKESGVFYKVADVGEEVHYYLEAQLISADKAAEISVLDAAGVFDGDDVEEVLAELFADQLDKKIWFTDDSAGSADYAKVYKIWQGANAPDAVTDPATLIGTINVPKDLVVHAGSVVEIFFDATDDTLHEGSISGPDVTTLIKGSTTPTEADAGKYIKLEIQNQTDPLYIAVKDLVDVYTGGTTAEATVAIDANNEITVTINKIAATKVIYQAESGQSGDPDYQPEINIKDKVDQVESDLEDLTEYVGEIPSTSQATDVIGYVDEKTGAGVSALNSEAGIASVASNVVTIKGGIVETEGLIENSASAAHATVVDGYLYEGKFYEEQAHTTEITPVTTSSYKDLTDNAVYNWTGHEFVLVRADIVLEEVAVTGAAADVSIADAGSLITATNVEDALQELATALTWQDV